MPQSKIINQKSKIPAVGVDIGGTHTKIALVAPGGQVLSQARILTGAAGSPQEFLSRLAVALEPLLPTRPSGIGLSLPGLLAPDRRSMTYNPNTPALVGLDFAAQLERYGLPVCLEQDLNAPALAEYHFGAGRGSARLLAVSMGTGAGAGVILDGQVLRFAGGTTGDAGHIILDPDGPACTGGCRGCAEALVTVPAIERLAADRLTDPRAASLLARASNSAVPASAVIALARQGDPLAGEILAQVGRLVGQWLASLAPLFLPDAVVLCGGVAEAGAVLLEPARRRFLELSGPAYTRCTLALSRFRGLAGAVGAAVPFLIAP